jgi:DNA-binding SARP family transcriptional activator
MAGAAAQRRTLALLALLAVAGLSGLSRDKLVGLLWPESDEERARHSLTQALYAARRAVGLDDLFLLTGNDVRLNAERVTSDVADFEEHCRSGEVGLAAERYTGPFLDGFYLNGAAEFERWTAMQRDRLLLLAVDAFERLAVAAESAGDRRLGVARARTLVGLDPLATRHALRLMRALAAAGDRAGALRQARLHGDLLREELDLEPDPAVEALAHDLRIEPADALTAVDGSPTSAPATPSVAPDPRRQRRRIGIRVAIAAIVIAIVALGIDRLRSGAAPEQVAAPRQQLVVAPFRVTGASTSLGYLRDGIVELLSTRLADDSLAHSVDAGAVLAAWRSAGLTASMDVPRTTLVGLAGRLGAERVVIGSVVGTSERAVISATLLGVPDGRVRAEASVAGRADSITTLLDRLAARLLLAEAGQDAAISRQTSRSLPALRAFLAGQAAYRLGDLDVALHRYDDAMARDSTFALAALYAATAADRLGRAVDVRRSVTAAWRAREELTAHDAILLTALAGPAYPAPSVATALIAAWQRPVELDPASADAWYGLAVRLVHEGAAAGVLDAPGRAISTLHHALLVSPGHRPSRELLLSMGEIALPVRADSLAALPSLVRWRAAVARGDSAALRRQRGSWTGLDASALRGIALASLDDAARPGDATAALALLHARAGTPRDQVDVILGEHALAMNEGRMAVATAAITRLRRAQPAGDAWLRLRVLDALYGEGSTVDGSKAAAALADEIALTRMPVSREIRLADACVLAQWRLARGDTAGVASIADSLRQAPPLAMAVPIATTPAACAILLDAALATRLRRPDALARVRAVDSLVFTAATAGDAAQYAPLMVARLLNDLGARAEALRATRSLVAGTGWPRYRSSALHLEGALADSLGDVPSAVRAFTRFVRYRAGTSTVSDTLAARAAQYLAARAAQ